MHTFCQQIERERRVVGVDITVQKNRLQKYKTTSSKPPGHRKNWTWLQTRKTNREKQKNTKIKSLEYKTSSQHMKQRKTDAKRNIGQLHSSHIKGISCF